MSGVSFFFFDGKGKHDGYSPGSIPPWRGELQCQKLSWAVPLLVKSVDKNYA
jgi:hypothetical protein